MSKLKLLINLIFSCFSFALATQNIQIVGGVKSNLISIAIIDFSNDKKNIIPQILTNDLKITGEFAVNNYRDSSLIKNTANYILTGEMINNEENPQINYILTDANTNHVVLNQNIAFNPEQLRTAVHTISNLIYQKLTATTGIFTTKIAYIAQLKSRKKAKTVYNLVVSDYDGYNPKIYVSSNGPMSSLAWNKSGNSIAFVGYSTGKPVVYTINFSESATMTLVANFLGSNSSPAFTPNDNNLVTSLSWDGIAHIYLIKNSKFNNKSSKSEIIKYGEIDTEADIDNKGDLVFTSNHDGGPQIFISNLNGAAPQRLTNGLGNYNTTGRLSLDGTKLVFINRDQGNLKTYYMDLTKEISYPVNVETTMNVSPSFAPNGKLILFSDNNKYLYIVPYTGIQKTKISTLAASQIIDQRWSNN